MPYNGAGLFNRVYNWTSDAANAIPIMASRMDAEDTGFASALSICLTRDGQSKPSADIDWNNHKITNLTNATGAQDAVNLQTGDGRWIKQNVTPNTQNANYIFVLLDINGTVLHTNSTAYAYTIPLNATTAFPIGSLISIVNNGSGIVTITPAGGVTLYAFGSSSSAAFALVQNCSTIVQKVAADTWIALGQTSVATTGSFTGTLTDMTTTVTGTVNYRVVGNIAHLWITSTINGTSNAVLMNMTGLPAAVQPTSRHDGATKVQDNSTGYQAGSYQVSGSTIVFEKSSGSFPVVYSPGNFTSSGTKGLIAGWTISYPLD